jgi:hypothetical protein
MLKRDNKKMKLYRQIYIIFSLLRIAMRTLLFSIFVSCTFIIVNRNINRINIAITQRYFL